MCDSKVGTRAAGCVLKVALKCSGEVVKVLRVLLYLLLAVKAL